MKLNEDKAVRLIQVTRENLGLRGNADACIRGLLHGGHSADAITDAYCLAVDRGVRSVDAWVVGYFKRLASGGQP